MPGFDRKFDPVTHDYVEEGGSFVLTSTLETALYHQLNDELNAWAGDAEAGSRLHLLQRGRNSEAEAVRTADEMEAAVKPFVDLGWATDFEVAIDRDQHGRWSLASSIKDVQHGTLELDDMIPFGG
jgi:phage gp46-like protein